MAISVVTITKNSASRIRGVVENALQLGDESIVVDTGSTDRTREIAHSAGARVVCYEGEFDYSSPRNLGSSLACNDWVLHLDDDERIDVKYAEIMNKATSNSQYTQYSVFQRLYMNGLVLPNKGSKQVRLFDRRHHTFQGRVYEWAYPYIKEYTLDVLLENHYSRGSRQEQEVESFRSKLAAQEFGELVNRDKKMESADHAYLISRFRLLWSFIPHRFQENVSLCCKDHFQRGLVETPNPTLFYETGHFLQKIGRSREANVVIRVGLNYGGKDDPNYLIQTALFNPSEEGIEFIEKALSIADTGYYRLLHHNFLNFFGRKREATYSFECAQQLFPDYVEIAKVDERDSTEKLTLKQQYTILRDFVQFMKQWDMDIVNL